MRIKNTLKNSLYAILSYFLLAILALAVRKVFIQFLPVEYLGYEGLFGNLFALIAIADLGIETVILYRMFPAFAKKDREEINKIIAIYKLLYRFVGLAIFIIGICLLPFLKFIISEQKTSWNYIYIVYLIQLLASLCTYFLAYKRLMFIVDQKEYICTKADTFCSVVMNVIRLAVIILFNSYILYLVTSLVTNIASNIIISNKIKKEYPFLNESTKVTFKDIQSLGINNDLKNNIVQKICTTIYSGTDNIMVSTFLGISKVGILANYYLIQSYITKFFTKLLSPFQMSIGNYIYSEDTESGGMFFRMFDFISFFIATVISISYMVLLNPFIELWLGSNYLLSNGFVFFFVFNQYITWNHQFLCYYRYSFGNYELDRTPIFIATILNIVLSISLCKSLGVTGVMLGTAVANIGIWYGRVRVVYSEYMKENIKHYFYRQIIRIILWGIELVIVYNICNFFQATPLGILERLLTILIIVCSFNFIFYSKTKEMKLIFEYIKKIKEVTLG